MRKDLKFVPGTDEDVAAFNFRIERRLGSICCTGHHAVMVTLCLAADQVDAEIMWTGVRSCTSMRWAELSPAEWLLDVYARETDVKASRRRFAELLAEEVLGIELPEPIKEV